MLSGFNTNIRHRGVLFHVQSEDSGRDHPHIITHLFHGGNIMVSRKSSYAEHVDAPDLDGHVKSQMESQHKAMLKSLVAGEFDELIGERLGDAFPAEQKPEATVPSEPEMPAEPAPAVPRRERPAPPAAGAPAKPREAAFGEKVVSEQPLDEVILGYLVESARKRKRSTS